MAVFTYDPKQVNFSFGGKPISGFSDGTFITVTRNEQAFNLKVGVDGEGTRAKSNNKSGKIEFELMQSSASNDTMTGFALADELSSNGTAPGLMRDSSGRSVFSFLTGWVQKMPDTPFAKEVQTRKWVIETDDLEYFIGGN